MSSTVEFKEFEVLTTLRPLFFSNSFRALPAIVPPEVHAKLDVTAKGNGESLNSFVAKTLENAVGE